MIRLVDKDDVKKGRIRDIKNEEETTNITARLSLIDAGEMIDESKVHKIDEKEKIIIRYKAKKNKKYHLLRWKIKRFLTKENVIKECISWETILDVFDQEIVDNDDLTDIEIKTIFNRYGHYLVEHHIRYKEIHGIDESIWMTPSEHRSLHNRLRKEGKCGVHPEELADISLRAVKRGKRFLNRILEYDKTEKRQLYRHEYYKKNVKHKVYQKTLVPNVILYEEITYNIKTNTLTITSGFKGGHGIKLPVIKID